MSDKKTIGISPSNAAALEALAARGNFGSELDAAKFAMGYAIRNGVAPGSTENAGTKWNVGSVDPDGAMRSLLNALYPERDDPYRLVEHFMNEGVKLLASPKSVDVYDVLFASPPLAET
jgi:hypothetical protein